MCSNQSVTDSANLVNHLLSASSTRIVVQDFIMEVDELRAEAGRWAGHLRSGHATGSRIGIVCENDQSFVIAYLACLVAGMVAVPLNPQSPSAERSRDIDSVGIAEVLVGPTVEPLTETINADGSSAKITLLDPGAATGEPLDAQTQAAVVGPDDPAILLFTSGTAGPSKPAILTHRNLLASLRSIEATGIDLRSEPHAVVGVVPLFHVLGINIILNLGLTIGATIILEPEFSATGIVKSVADHKVSILAGPPNMWQALAELSPESTIPLRQLRVAMSGAAPLDAVVAEKLRSAHMVDLREGYGLTETAGVLCSGVGADSVEVGSVGPVMAGIECRLVDGNGEDVLIGDVGEVWVKGPMVSPGYFQDEAATTRSRTPDGWFCTGDLAIVDERGHLSIAGRTKDLVIVSGFNVHPGEVERVLQAHPWVEAAAVVGVPDPYTGERVSAFVVLTAEGDPDEAESVLRSHCASELARYKLPKQVNVVAELPIGVAGKLRRRDLAAQ